MSETEKDSLTLYRPVGFQELELIRQTNNQAFPPRLPEQPIFYPTVGGDVYQKYWIPAEDLTEFNRNILGEIEVIAEFEN